MRNIWPISSGFGSWVGSRLSSTWMKDYQGILKIKTWQLANEKFDLKALPETVVLVIKGGSCWTWIPPPNHEPFGPYHLCVKRWLLPFNRSKSEFSFLGGQMEEKETGQNLICGGLWKLPRKQFKSRLHTSREIHPTSQTSCSFLTGLDVPGGWGIWALDS